MADLPSPEVLPSEGVAMQMKGMLGANPKDVLC
jgi:hypothetical protein